MLKSSFLISIFPLLSIFLTSSILAISIGEIAPDFDLPGTHKLGRMKDHRGKYIVLEWYNDGCPFVRKHYDSKNMQNLQRDFKEKVSWLTVSSSAKGRQGYLKDTMAAMEMYTKEQMNSLSLLLDSKGVVGKTYGAKTTPHMYIIDPKGNLIYQGAIDSIASADPNDVGKSTNYVRKALDEALSGKPVTVAKSQPYGCSVKY